MKHYWQLRVFFLLLLYNVLANIPTWCPPVFRRQLHSTAWMPLHACMVFGLCSERNPLLWLPNVREVCMYVDQCFLHNIYLLNSCFTPCTADVCVSPSVVHLVQVSSTATGVQVSFRTSGADCSQLSPAVRMKTGLYYIITCIVIPILCYINIVHLTYCALRSISKDPIVIIYIPPHPHSTSASYGCPHPTFLDWWWQVLPSWRTGTTKQVPCTEGGEPADGSEWWSRVAVRLPLQHWYISLPQLLQTAGFLPLCRLQHW